MLFTSLVAAALLTAAPPLQRASEVADSIGANIHIEYTDGDYRSVEHVVDCLRYIGVSHVRDAAPNPHNQGQGGYAALAAAGMRFDLFINGEEIAPALNRIAAFRRSQPDAVDTIEGINEVNNHGGFTYQGISDPHQAAVAYQNRLYNEAKRIPELAKLPVLGFTDYPSHFGASDVANVHSYPHSDDAPAATLEAANAEAAQHLPGKPIVVTELGYSTARGGGGVSELAQSRLLLVSLLEEAAAGVKRVYIYQLLDAYPDPAAGDAEKHFGVFQLGYSAKPAARMLHRVTRIYHDGAADAADFRPQPLRLTWRGGDASVRKLVVTKADGTTIAAVWRDQAVYDSARRDDVSRSSVALDLLLPASHGAVSIDDPVAGSQGRPRPDESSTRLQLGGDPLIVTIARR